MDIDYPLLLTVATALAGAAWLWERAQRRRAPGGARPARAGLSWIAESAAELFPVLAAVLVLRSFLFEPFQIPSQSMEPTLSAGDFVVVSKYSYGLRLPVSGARVASVGSPERGDVMVFFPPGDDRYFIKRVIGLPGDRIEFDGRALRINGDPAPAVALARSPTGRRRDREAYVERLGGREYQVRYSRMRSSDAFSVTVHPGHYFVMGDNRDNSRDSRNWGQVPERNIVGRAVAIWMHWNEFFSWPSLSRNAWIH